MNKVFLFTILLVSISGCADDKDVSFMNPLGNRERPLEIITKVLTFHSPNFIQEFTQETVIGLYVCTEKTGNLYNDNMDYKNIKAEIQTLNNKQVWHQTPTVYLHSEPAIVYAYSPYQKQVSLDATCIPVKISPDATLTKDYMYGIQAAGQKAVNNVSPVVLLDMNHALSLLSFQIGIKDRTAGHYRLSAIQIGNKAGGTALCCRGKMDIKTGEISGCAGTNASTRLTFDSPKTLYTRPAETHSILVIPTRQIVEDGDVEILFVINGTTYKYSVPAQTQWKKGHKYLYEVSFDGSKITLDKVTCHKWSSVEEINKVIL